MGTILSNTKDPLLDLADLLPDEDPLEIQEKIVAQQKYGPDTIYWTTRRLWEGRLVASIVHILQMDWNGDEESKWKKDKCIIELAQDLPAILQEIELCGGPSWTEEYFWNKLQALLEAQRKKGKRFDVRELSTGFTESETEN